MNKKNTKTLLEKYPKLFIQHTWSIKDSAMPWLFECGDGWFWLIDNLCNCIQSYIDDNKHLKIKQIETTQVKEKFATLRFYVNYSNELIDGMIWLAEHMSAGICESCGSNENVTQNKKGYIQSLCKKCRKQEPTLN